MRLQYLTLLSLLTIIVNSQYNYVVDVNQSNMYSNASILDTTCNKDMELDFSFSKSTVLTCQNSTCTLVNPALSTLYYLDTNRVYLNLTLVNAQVTMSNIVTGFNVTNETAFLQTLNYFIFYFRDEYGNKVDVLVPFTASGNTDAQYVIAVDKITDATFYGEHLDDLVTISDPANGFQLHKFNFMNLRDFGKFMQVANSYKNHTLLINEWIFSLPYSYPNTSMTSDSPVVVPGYFTPDYYGTGNKICYASYWSKTGLFQTHLRQNWPLWACFFILLVFWMYIMISSSQGSQVFNDRFRNNKMTCWSIYSLYHLVYEQFYSRLSRASLLLFTNALHGTILAALYTTVGISIKLYSNYTIIIWFALVATACALPLPYIMGGLFLKRIYRSTYHQLQLKQQYKEGGFSKQKQVELYKQIYQLQYRLSVLYFWYYLIIFYGFICLWAGSIHMVLWMRWQFYYLQRLWLASLGICFFIQNFIIDPILTCLLGNTNFYKMRGFYYNFELGSIYRKTEIEM